MNSPMLEQVRAPTKTQATEKRTTRSQTFKKQLSEKLRETRRLPVSQPSPHLATRKESNLCSARDQQHAASALPFQASLTDHVRDLIVTTFGPAIAANERRKVAGKHNSLGQMSQPHYPSKYEPRI